MENVEQRVRKIIAEQLGVNEAEIKNESSFVDDLGADAFDNAVELDWESAHARRAGITRISRFDPSRLASQIAGEVKGFDVAQYMSPKEARRMDVFIHYGMAAALQAWREAGLEVTPDNAERIGINFGSG